jgi:hypothetical protein
MSFETNFVVDNDNYNSKDLSEIFPCFEILSKSVSGDNEDETFNFTLTKNKTGTTKYFVFTSYEYLSAGSGGTYSPHEASSAANSLMVYDRTATTFQVKWRKSTGEKWDGTVNCSVIYDV